jgi:alkylhydroperoxidase/carboxymuconolactone decarboxylase family protein YurZ
MAISFDGSEHPKLSQRDRSLITVAYLVALNRVTELPFRVNEALENGVSRQEIIELVAYLARIAANGHPDRQQMTKENGDGSQ